MPDDAMTSECPMTNAQASMAEAKTALRLCLRQLREGDRFAVIAFDDSIETMAPGMTLLTRAK